jgi:ArsR family transcriptional regulator
MPLQSAHDLVAALKAAAEPTRLRILALLASGALSVKDLTKILGQSQPRLSRHLKLLAEAGLVERSPEGSWVYFYLADRKGGLARQILAAADPADVTLVRDRQRAEAVKREREAAAQSYFAEQAADWDRIRALHVAEADVEAALARAFGPGDTDLLVDLGTGTGRVLELFAPRYRRGVGFDVNPAMLSYARAKLDRAGVRHAQVRHGDIYDVPLPDRSAGVVVLHQILHYLADPGRAVQEAARILAPGGRLRIVDFAPHDLEFLRDDFAHVRLGFAKAEVGQWLEAAGLSLCSVRDLVPPASEGTGKVTVSIWLAERPGTRAVRGLNAAMAAGEKAL